MESHGLICCCCKKAIVLEPGTHPEEVMRIPDGPVCEGCYYGVLGEEIEKHPIPGLVRR